MKPLAAVYYLIIFSVTIIFAVAVDIITTKVLFCSFIHPQLQLGDKSRMEGSPSESHGIVQAGKGI